MSTTHPGAPERAPDRTASATSAVTGPRPSTPDPQALPDPRGVAGWQWQRWISPVLVVVVWQLASSTGLLAEDELASPVRVARAAWDVTASGELPEGLGVSLVRVLVGLVIGVVLGAVLGLASGLSRWAGLLVDPPVQMLRTLPHLALVPLFILWFGVEETPKILLVALGVLFPIYLNVHAGVRDVDPKLLEATRVSGFTRGTGSR